MTNRIDPQSLTGTRVRVHFNLHTHMWSVTALSGDDKGRVIANVGNITLKGVEFKVSEAGRARSYRLGKRTVHAWVVGTVATVDADCSLAGLERVSYNPSPDRPATFARVDGTPVFQADTATFARCPNRPGRGYAWI